MSLNSISGRDRLCARSNRDERTFSEVAAGKKRERSGADASGSVVSLLSASTDSTALGGGRRGDAGGNGGGATTQIKKTQKSNQTEIYLLYLCYSLDRSMELAKGLIWQQKINLESNQN